MKTILEHFQTFPAEWRAEALHELYEAPLYAGDTTVATPALALASGFYWAGADENQDEWEKWNERHKQLCDMEVAATPPPPLSNTNLLIGCLYELHTRFSAASDNDLAFFVTDTIDSTLSALNPPCDLSKWNNDYPS